MLRSIALLFLPLVVSCAVGYEPANARGQGYYDMVRDDGTVVVTYRGNEHTTLHNAQRFAICRAAEVMTALHHQRFAVVEERVGDPDPTTETTCTYFFFSHCVTEHSPMAVVTLVVRPVESAQETKGLTYLSEDPSSCRKAQVESDRQ